MKKFTAILALVLALFAAPALAETVILSTTTAAASPAYGVGGLAKVYVQVEAASGTATATVTIEQRMSSTASWQTIKTITDPKAGDTAYSIEPVGEIRVNASAVSVGTVRAILNAYDYNGKAKW